MHAVLRGGLDAQRRLRVEVPGAFAANHQVTVVCSRSQRRRSSVAMPRSITTRRRAGRGVRRASRRACVLAHIAGEDLRAAHEAAGVEHQPQGEERAIGTFVLGVSA